MQAVIKILMSLDVPDDLAGRRRFREIVDQLKPYLPDDAELRDFKMIEDGTGRLIEAFERSE
ncbi:MAG: hypothetical protein ACOC29_01015 [Candidatus Sumerlaeota bacterium]